jgi:hypothetical protein
MEENRKSNGGKRVVPFAKNTYRVVNEPFRIMGILDSNYAIAAVVPAVACGLFGAATNPMRFLVGGIAFLVFAYQAYRISEDDAKLPLVLWLTLTDKSHAAGFTKQPTKPGEGS